MHYRAAYASLFRSSPRDCFYRIKKDALTLLIFLSDYATIQW